MAKPKSALTSTRKGRSSARKTLSDFHDEVQIALAIAEENILKSLLVNCTPPLADYHRIGNITSSIGLPTRSQQTVDGMVQFEEIHCVLVDTPVRTDPQTAQPNRGNLPRLGNLDLTRCATELQTLGRGMSLAQAIALLAHSGFSPQQVEAILNLPCEAWHKTWWYTLDEQGNFSVPFLRILRTLRYTDGTFTIQYQDHFSQDKPTCFRSQEHQVLIEIQPKLEGFSATLGKINRSRQDMAIDRAILICNTLSALEARGFISQGISVYSATEFVLPMQASCRHCATLECPLQGRSDSPVLMCRRYCLEACNEE